MVFFALEAPHEIRLGDWQDTPHAIVLSAVLRDDRGKLLRDIARSSSTAVTSATSITAKFLSLHSNIMRWPHDNVPDASNLSANGLTPSDGTANRQAGPCLSFRYTQRLHLHTAWRTARLANLRCVIDP